MPLGYRDARQVSCIRRHSPAASINSYCQITAATSSPPCSLGRVGQLLRHSDGTCFAGSDSIRGINCGVEHADAAIRPIAARTSIRNCILLPLQLRFSRTSLSARIA